MTAPTISEIDAALLDRLRRAEPAVTWESVPAPSKAKGPPGKARIARLHDETARVEESTASGRYRLTAESGPLGAMLILLACAERGRPTYLASRAAGELPAFAQGAVEAAWGGPKKAPTKGAPRIADLVAVARYALP
ncbi:MAG TPA: hypothetical protein VFF67_02985 [Thermoplasmata archaeon]|nr:hypothetical protein [Thermoplasmata archaeon]